MKITAIDNVTLNGLHPRSGSGPQSDQEGRRQTVGNHSLPTPRDAATHDSQSASELFPQIEKLNAAMKAYGLEFDLSRSDGQIVTRIIEIDSGEVIRQIPNETVLQLSERLGAATGVLVNEKA